MGEGEGEVKSNRNDDTETKSGGNVTSWRNEWGEGWAK